jgi:ubiquinone/menaquinone biosynthesis C-methylase UbiE
MTLTQPSLPHETRLLQAKYNSTAWFYDLLDYPWERRYRRWRPQYLGDVRGEVLEAGVGTGRNLAHYHPSVHLTAVDLSPAMLRKARDRAAKAACRVDFVAGDVTHMDEVAENHYDWLVSTFLCCVMPDTLQPLALSEFRRVLKPGARFRILEILYSKNPRIRRRQERLARFVEKVYGARFDRSTLRFLEETPCLRITNTTYLKDDTYLLIDGICAKSVQQQSS